jgi:hypothetical protein
VTAGQSQQVDRAWSAFLNSLHCLLHPLVAVTTIFVYSLPPLNQVYSPLQCKPTLNRRPPLDRAAIPRRASKKRKRRKSQKCQVSFDRIERSLPRQGVVQNKIPGWFPALMLRSYPENSTHQTQMPSNFSFFLPSCPTAHIKTRTSNHNQGKTDKNTLGTRHESLENWAEEEMRECNHPKIGRVQS